MGEHQRMDRRTFMTRLASTVAAIALAPQLCRMGAWEMPVAWMPPTAELTQIFLDEIHTELLRHHMDLVLYGRNEIVIASKPLHPEFGITVRHVKS